MQFLNIFRKKSEPAPKSAKRKQVEDEIEISRALVRAFSRFHPLINAAIAAALVCLIVWLSGIDVASTKATLADDMAGGTVFGVPVNAAIAYGILFAKILTALVPMMYAFRMPALLRWTALAVSGILFCAMFFNSYERLQRQDITAADSQRLQKDEVAGYSELIAQKKQGLEFLQAASRQGLRNIWNKDAVAEAQSQARQALQIQREIDALESKRLAAKLTKKQVTTSQALGGDKYAKAKHLFISAVLTTANFLALTMLGFVLSVMSRDSLLRKRELVATPHIQVGEITDLPQQTAANDAPPPSSAPATLPAARTKREQRGGILVGGDDAEADQPRTVAPSTVAPTVAQQSKAGKAAIVAPVGEASGKRGRTADDYLAALIDGATPSTRGLVEYFKERGQKAGEWSEITAALAQLKTEGFLVAGPRNGYAASAGLWNARQEAQEAEYEASKYLTAARQLRATGIGATDLADVARDVAK